MGLYQIIIILFHICTVHILSKVDFYTILLTSFGRAYYRHIQHYHYFLQDINYHNYAKWYPEVQFNSRIRMPYMCNKLFRYFSLY